MHKEEFYSTLLEDRFISFLIRQIKISAKDGNMEEILRLIENLEYDTFQNNSYPNANNMTKKNQKNIESKTNGKEMTRFSSFLDLQLKEIVERQNALEKQILTLKANNDINTLSNLNSLINEKVEEIYSKSDIPYCNNSATKILENNINNLQQNRSKNINQNTNNNHGHSIIKECNHHFHSHSINSIKKSDENLDAQIQMQMNTLKINNGMPINNNNHLIKNHSNHNHASNLNGNNHINCKENTNNSINYNTNGQGNQKMNHISKNINMMGNFHHNKNENYSTIDELVNYIETNNNENKTKKNKKKRKNSKKKTQQNKSPSVNKNSNRVIDETVVENFKQKIYQDSSMACQIRKIKPCLSVKWLKSINNI